LSLVLDSTILFKLVVYDEGGEARDTILKALEGGFLEYPRNEDHPTINLHK